MEKRILVITGPTATGKSALGICLAHRLDGEIISADSMQIYRGMDIGTAKISLAEMQGIPHHMLDIVDPLEPFSVARWVEIASNTVEDILSRGKVPILVGGTGLYIDSLLSGRIFAEDPGAMDIRDSLSKEYDRIGGAAFKEELRLVDPERAAILHPADKKRLVRAMEVYRLTGETISAHDQRTKALPPRWDSLRFALSYTERGNLYHRIDLRVDEMVASGLLNEVRTLLENGLRPDCTAMQAIGYKEIAEYLSGQCNFEEAVLHIKQNSRRYAKRQLTWFRRDHEMHWILWNPLPDIELAANEVSSLWRSSAI